ncbi:MAG: hypothetical protein A3B81_01540 [Candidatus Muproteobacteria bacterium RIFCSPHIGHO2_02_FULL_65_16]|uniref:Diguanylate cyclase n=1 Tax=Candidatus Muproteobacteria bacterium RIFCSPHIGHO2_02_FULL_65_16 TaxID=1817766 RepID=A0A1F6TYV8_9PROT|nr:MAG: hypothetical protein A3B81_01540 [Candidatus Muproteobacteria bacterium RIFCSPHIGHO2_02_FULL_65_16]
MNPLKKSHQDIIGALAVMFGLAGLVSEWTGLRSGILPHPLAGVCFVLSGAALLLPHPPSRLRRHGLPVIGCAIALLATAGLMYELFDFFRGAARLPAFLATDLHPGGIAPNAAIGFVLFGLTLALVNVVRNRFTAGLVQLFIVTMVFIGLVDLAGSLLRLDAVSAWYEYTKMTPFAAAGLSLLGLGLASIVYHAEWYQRFYYGREDRKIMLLSGLIVLVIAGGGGVTGFSVLAATAEAAQLQTLRLALESRRHVFHEAVEAAVEKAAGAGRDQKLHALAEKLAAADGQRGLDAIYENLRHTTGASGVALYDGRSRVLAARGSFHDDRAVMVALPLGHEAYLLWRNGTVLNVVLPVGAPEPRGANLSVDIPLPEIDQLFTTAADTGKTGVTEVCARQKEGVLCFTDGADNFRARPAPRRGRGETHPMGLALDGRLGVGHGLDGENRRTVAAYGPIEDLGLGMTVSMASAELYAPILIRFQQLLLMLLALAFGGVLLLRWQIAPLTRKLLEEIGERRAAEDHLTFVAHHDSLTGLPNRALFNDRLKQALIDAGRHKRVVGVMFLDLDNFKNINDSFGHKAGDLLLQGVAERLGQCLRPGDTVSRLSGDEFTLILGDMAQAGDANRLAQKIVEDFRLPYGVDGREIFVTASLGVALFPLDSRDREELLKYADIAMYRAKEQGKNSYQFYAAEMSAAATERLLLQSGLRVALERKEFTLHYQPQVDMTTGRIVGMEALVRWKHPERGWIPPDKFIPIAEEIGLITPIGEWVLRTACAQNKAWEDAGLSGYRVAVNISGHQIRQQDFVEAVTRVLRQTGLRPQSLGLELTESVLMHGGEENIAKLRMLEVMGIHISIDDFGTGYSSLGYLKLFPIDVLKIDRTFVRDVTTNPDDAAIASAIITLAHSLGIQVVAEGVETKEQLAFLRSRRCDGIQGYYFSKPLPAGECEALLRSGKRLQQLED